MLFFAVTAIDNVFRAIENSGEAKEPTKGGLNAMQLHLLSFTLWVLLGASVSTTQHSTATAQGNHLWCPVDIDIWVLDFLMPHPGLSPSTHIRSCSNKIFSIIENCRPRVCTNSSGSRCSCLQTGCNMTAVHVDQLTGGMHPYQQL